MTMTAVANDIRDSNHLTVPKNDYLTMVVHDQMFGVPVLTVQDVLGQQSLTRVPMAPSSVAGVLNLRGHVITAIDVRDRLKLPPRSKSSPFMSVVVDHDGELYSLNVDSVGDVLDLSSYGFEDNPATLAPQWRSFSRGIFWLDGQLLVALDVSELLGSS